MPSRPGALTYAAGLAHVSGWSNAIRLLHDRARDARAAPVHACSVCVSLLQVKAVCNCCDTGFGVGRSSEDQTYLLCRNDDHFLEACQRVSCCCPTYLCLSLCML